MPPVPTQVEVENSKKLFLESKMTLVEKLKSLSEQLEMLETPLNGDVRNSFMDKMKNVQDVLLKDFDQKSFNYYEKLNPVTPDELSKINSDIKNEEKKIVGNM